MAYPVTWFEVIGKNGKQTREFYEKAFGWKMNVDDSMDYGMLEASEGIPGGIGGGEPAVRVYVQTDDVKGALAKVEKAGGKTVMPETDMGMVTIAQFSDPDGNVLGIWRPNQQ